MCDIALAFIWEVVEWVGAMCTDEDDTPQSAHRILLYRNVHLSFDSESTFSSIVSTISVMRLRCVMEHGGELHVSGTTTGATW